MLSSVWSSVKKHELTSRPESAIAIIYSERRNTSMSPQTGERTWAPSYPDKKQLKSQGSSHPCALPLLEDVRVSFRKESCFSRKTGAPNTLVARSMSRTMKEVLESKNTSSQRFNSHMLCTQQPLREQLDHIAVSPNHASQLHQCHQTDVLLVENESCPFIRTPCF